MLPTEILPLLTVPGTDQVPRLVVESFSGDEPFSGWLIDRNRQVVARLLNFRFRFTGFDPEAETTAAFRCHIPLTLPPEPRPVPLPLGSSRLQWQGEWQVYPYRMDSAAGAESRVTFTTEAPLIGLGFLGGPDAGIVEVRRDETLVAELDLYSPAAGLPARVTVEHAGDAPCAIALRPSGRRNPAASGEVVRLAGIEEYSGPAAAPAPRAPLPPLLDDPELLPPFMAWLAELPAEALALDIGGTPRRLADRRVLQLDWLAFDAPHLLGDPLALPFRSDSLDLLHANTAINRVADPALFAREVHRVLKPGGRAIIGAMPGRWARYGAPHLIDLGLPALRALFAGFSERHEVSGGGIADRTLEMLRSARLDGTGNTERLARIREELEALEAQAPPGVLQPLALWSVLELRK